MVVDFNLSHVREWMVSSVPVITPRTTVATALRLLREHKVPALPVVADGRLLGLVDEKEMLRYTPSEATTLDVYELHDVLEKMTVGRITCPAPGSVAPDAPLGKAAELMLSTHRDVVPVVDGGRLLGLVTSASLVAAAAGTLLPAGDFATPAGERG
jgi:acetoin utilization protein AcuB